MAFEVGYWGVDIDGREYVIVDVTPDYYILEYKDGTHQSIIRTD